MLFSVLFFLFLLGIFLFSFLSIDVLNYVLSTTGRSKWGNLKGNSNRLSLANRERRGRCDAMVLTSFPEAQENVIDVLPLDAAVVPRQVLPVFSVVDEVIHVPDVP